MKTTGDQQLVKRINRSVLLRLLRAQPGLSRSRLARQSGLTKSTVSALVRELLDDAWVSEAGTSSAAGPGRPSIALHINAKSMALIGVEIAVESVRVACVSLLGDLLDHSEQRLKAHAPALVCAQVAAMVAQAHVKLRRRRLRVLGVGMGLPGAMDKLTGLVRFAPNLGWRNVDILPLMARALAKAGLPDVNLHLQNEADVAALSEYEFSPGENEDPLIFVNCDVGVGAGIILNDQLFTGVNGLAGEIGHTIMQANGPLCSCGRHGCAEVFIGSRSLTRPAALERASQMLGLLLQNLWTLFDPRVMVVGGASCLAHPALLQGAMRTLAQVAQSAGLPAPTVRAARYGLLAPAVGAAALVLHQALRPLHRFGPSAQTTMDLGRARK